MQAIEIMPAGRFSKPQLDLLKMFTADIPDKDWEAIREHVKLYFAGKATAEMDALFDENGWQEEKIEELLNTHLRTPYNK